MVLLSPVLCPQRDFSKVSISDNTAAVTDTSLHRLSVIHKKQAHFFFFPALLSAGRLSELNKYASWLFKRSPLIIGYLAQKTLQQSKIICSFCPDTTVSSLQPCGHSCCSNSSPSVLANECVCFLHAAN